MTQTEDNTHCCPLCVVDITDTKVLQQQDQFCTRIAKMMEEPKSRFNGRDSDGYDSTGLLYHINKENGKEYKATIVPKVLIKQYSRKCMTILAILALAKHIPLLRGTTVGLR